MLARSDAGELFGQLGELLWQALQQLYPEMRKAVVEEMDYREIARVLQVPEGTAKSLVSRARAALRRTPKKIEVLGRPKQTRPRGDKRRPPREVELLLKGLQVAGSADRLVEWMQTPVPSLNNQTPYSLMGTQEGRKQVEVILGRIEHGVY